MTSAALPYHEPGIVDILVLSSFLLLLNVVNSVIDNYLYCGLIGQILIGIAWGGPGADWLSISTQETITHLGYVGLILLVFEGGIMTSFTALRMNLLLSVAVASGGILLPMALSFSLVGMANATPLQAFAAGAALCSTSLGTTFTLLTSSGLVKSRLGVVLSSAAMLDDVVGLIMVQVISNLGTSSLNAVSIVRPVFVSIAFATLLPMACLFIVKPTLHSYSRHRQRSIPRWIGRIASGTNSALAAHTLLLIAFVTGANYAGTSSLFTAYLAGAAISWWDSEKLASSQRHENSKTQSDGSPTSLADRRGSGLLRLGPEQPPTDTREKTVSVIAAGHEKDKNSDGREIYAQFFEIAVRRILKPFFFASIGFSIPISQMLSASVVWRGIIYTALMILGKLACGLWVLPFKALIQPPSGDLTASKPLRTRIVYPPSILGFAMVARGEIGFLIASIAESNGIYQANKGSHSDSTSELFLIVSWAIVLCTIIGPICVGVFLRSIRHKKTFGGPNRQEEEVDEWGIWGVKPV